MPRAGKVDPEAHARLHHARALVIGPAAIVAARDVCGLSPGQTRQVSRWAAEALLARALADATGAARSARRARAWRAVR